jgi:hypothetical protein
MGTRHSWVRRRIKQNSVNYQVLVAHAYNRSYSGGREKDCGSKPAQANSLWDPISKNPSQKK